MNTMVNLKFNAFHLQLLYNNYDFHYTWLEHGGFTGHIEYKKREELKTTRRMIDKLMIKNVIDNPSDFPVLNTYAQALTFLSRNTSQNKAQPVDCEFEYFLISGFSRCGGTFLLDEYSRMKGLDLNKEHIEFSHDFFPIYALGSSINHNTKLPKLEQYDSYFATMIAHSIYYGRKAFFRRTVWGAFMIPYIREIKRLFPGMTLFCRHIIRNVHGAYHSIKRIYNGFDTTLMDISLSKNSFDTDFGNIVMIWFMQNTSILPTVSGLPFWDISVDTDKSCAEINQQITKIIDNYLKNHENSHSYNLGKPKIIKFGKEAETECLKDARSFNNVEYQPGKFNYKSVEEVDDKYTEVYELLLAQLTRLYQAFGLNFDGKLDRI